MQRRFTTTINSWTRAIKLLLCLQKGKLLSGEDVAFAAEIPHSTAVGLFMKMKDEGFVRVTQGRTGGQTLIRDLDSIYIKDVLQMVAEGSPVGDEAVFEALCMLMSDITVADVKSLVDEIEEKKEEYV